VRLRQGNVHEPDTTASFVTLQIRIVVIQEGEDGSDEDWNALLV
jgi:hypothetical protein